MDLYSMERSVAKDYENPAVFGINKRAPHVPLRSYTDKKQILNYYGTLDKKTTSPRVQLLDGKSWRFRYFENPHLVPVGFENVLFEDDDWNEVRPRLCMFYPNRLNHFITEVVLTRSISCLF